MTVATASGRSVRADDRSPPNEPNAPRCAICSLRVGPDAPTLCEGWDDPDLATHLVVRERKPLAGPGLVMGGAAAALDGADHGPHQGGPLLRRHSWPWCARARRRAAPRSTRLMNLTEYFVHHEDVRRGGGDTTPRPAAERRTVEDALWQIAAPAAPSFMTRPVKETASTSSRPDGEVIHVRAGDARSPRITGRAGEIVLFLSGRGAAAHVELGGTPDAVAGAARRPLRPVDIAPNPGRAGARRAGSAAALP